MDKREEMSEVGAAGVCRMQCQTGGACDRKMCTGATALAKNVLKAAYGAKMTGLEDAMEKIETLCNEAIDAEAVNGEMSEVGAGDVRVTPRIVFEHGTAMLSPETAQSVAKYVGECKRAEVGAEIKSAAYAEAEFAAICLLGMISMLPGSPRKEVCKVVAANLARRLRNGALGVDQEVANG